MAMSSRQSRKIPLTLLPANTYWKWICIFYFISSNFCFWISCCWNFALWQQCYCITGLGSMRMPMWKICIMIEKNKFITFWENQTEECCGVEIKRTLANSIWTGPSGTALQVPQLAAAPLLRNDVLLTYGGFPNESKVRDLLAYMHVSSSACTEHYAPADDSDSCHSRCQVGRAQECQCQW